LDATGLKKVIAQKKGKVVVVNFWATWCGPCKEEFPDLVKLAQKYPGKVELITIACDEAKDNAKGVVPYLTKQKALRGGYINKEAGTIDGFLKLLEPKAKDASIPRTYLFNKQGKLAKTLIGKQTPAVFDAAVKALL
jgi:thiol-disulfide isomerase/thioredoxin